MKELIKQLLKDGNSPEDIRNAIKEVEAEEIKAKKHTEAAELSRLLNSYAKTYLSDKMCHVFNASILDSFIICGEAEPAPAEKVKKTVDDMFSKITGYDPNFIKVNGVSVQEADKILSDWLKKQGF